jgi:hypothetical protein
MKTVLVHAAMLSTLTASAAYAAAPANAPNPLASPAVSDGEGAAGGRGMRLAAAAAGTLLFVPEAAKQSLLVTVGEGGEGKRGKHFRKAHRYKYVHRYRHYHRGPYHVRRYWYGSGYYRHRYNRRFYGRCPCW